MNSVAERVECPMVMTISGDGDLHCFMPDIYSASRLLWRSSEMPDQHCLILWRQNARSKNRAYFGASGCGCAPADTLPTAVAGSCVPLTRLPVFAALPSGVSATGRFVGL